MEINDIVMQMMFADIIEKFSKQTGKTLDESLDYFYESTTYEKIKKGLYVTGENYLTDELMIEYGFMENPCCEYKRLHISEVRTTEDYKLIFKLEDGTIKMFDMNPHLDKGIFLELRNYELFKQVKVTSRNDTIEWPNGADIDPETLYEDAITI